MRSRELVTVYTLADSVKAEIIKNALDAEGIHCFLEGANQAGGLSGVNIKVQVPEDDVEHAREILAEHERPGRQLEEEEPSTDITDLSGRPGLHTTAEPSTDITDLGRRQP
jgi:hypothetical protein